jgi:hypothetical protein
VNRGSLDIICTPKSGAGGPEGFTLPSTIGAICAFDAKIGFRRRRKMRVSRLQEGSKNFLKKMDFWF